MFSTPHPPTVYTYAPPLIFFSLQKIQTSKGARAAKRQAGNARVKAEGGVAAGCHPSVVADSP